MVQRPLAHGFPNARLPWYSAAMDETLGQRCVKVAMLELSVREVPSGSNTSARIREYLAGCVRDPGAVPLRLTASNWCAAFVSWCQAQALHPGEHPAHGWRAGVIEIERDARGGDFSGRWHPIDEVRQGIWIPKPGDLGVYDRSLPASRDPDAKTSWWRHIDRVVEMRADGTYQKIGGNEADRVRLGEESIDNPKLLGFASYPHAASQVTTGASPTPMLSEAQRREIEARVALSLDGILRDSIWERRDD